MIKTNNLVNKICYILSDRRLKPSLLSCLFWGDVLFVGFEAYMLNVGLSQSLQM